jgi:hypothetical protein
MRASVAFTTSMIVEQRLSVVHRLGDSLHNWSTSHNGLPISSEKLSRSCHARGITGRTHYHMHGIGAPPVILHQHACPVPATASLDSLQRSRINIVEVMQKCLRVVLSTAAVYSGVSRHRALGWHEDVVGIVSPQTLPACKVLSPDDR